MSAESPSGVVGDGSPTGAERSVSNAYLVMTSEPRTYVEPITDDGRGPEFECWPMAPVVAETPGQAKSLFLRAYAHGRSTGVESDDFPNLRARVLEHDVDLPVGVREEDDRLWALIPDAIPEAL